jgi:hypothetical protein
MAGNDESGPILAPWAGLNDNGSSKHPSNIGFIDIKIVMLKERQTAQKADQKSQ